MNFVSISGANGQKRCCGPLTLRGVVALSVGVALRGDDNRCQGFCANKSVFVGLMRIAGLKN